jgi:Uma2 family endonuclease
MSKEANERLRSPMATVEQRDATVEDLYSTDGKAELIRGTIVRLMPTGRKPNRVALRIVRSLDDYAENAGVGEAYTDNMGFVVPELSSGRRSFSPDASLYSGPFPDDELRFIEGPPTFAAEVRSENDYGDAAERILAEKRADYFEAGTLVVWDVDPVNECIHVYRHTDTDHPVTYGRGEAAEAEPAVPGWQVAVDRIIG